MITMAMATAIVRIGTVAPSFHLMIPVSEFARMELMLWSRVKVPMAVAVSFLNEIFEIQALDILSVVEA